MLDGAEGPNAAPFTRERIARMYQYLASIGRVYIIEVREGESYTPVGDVALSERMIPIVIGDARWRGRGVGTAALQEVLELARRLGFSRLTAHRIFLGNQASERLFARVGFRRDRTGVDDEGHGYGVWVLDLRDP